MATMYELTADYMAVLNMAADGEIPAEAVADTLEAIEGEIEIKAENTAIVMKELDAEAAKLKAEEMRLEERRKAIENNIKTIKDRLFNAMKLTGKEKFKTTLFSFSIKKNPVKLVIDNEACVPDEYLIPQPAKVDSKGLKEAIQNGEEFACAHLEQGESLMIK